MPNDSPYSRRIIGIFMDALRDDTEVPPDLAEAIQALLDQEKPPTTDALVGLLSENHKPEAASGSD